MMYQLCPRCQFKVPVNKHACTTCGLDIAAHNAKYKQAPGNAAQNLRQNMALSSWISNFGSKPKKAQDNRHEEPALGET